MKINLYPFAEKWREKGNIWFYSDPHFSDDEMKYLRTNYISDDEQVKRINSKVGKNDTIIFLGDIGKVDYIRKIKGYKVLIKGNHDSGNINYIRKIGYIENHQFIEKDNHLFDEIYEGILTISDKIILSHEPVDLPFIYNIHGHDHSNKYFNDNLHFNACAELIDYTPISLNDIVKTGVLKNIDSIHRITIDEATQRKRENI